MIVHGGCIFKRGIECVRKSWDVDIGPEAYPSSGLRTPLGNTSGSQRVHRTEKLEERERKEEEKGVSRRRKSVGGQRGFRVAVADSDGSGGGSGVVEEAEEEEEEKAEVRSRRTGGWQEPLDPAGYGKSDRAVGFLPENHDERVVVQENEQVANERLERDQQHDSLDEVQQYAYEYEYEQDDEEERGSDIVEENNDETVEVQRTTTDFCAFTGKLKVTGMHTMQKYANMCKTFKVAH
ncbi:hypothetical protein WN51_04229 [Melipona quadrifasciata]|uniref:Uncharacterized protein n=1 Tax=Melipona quadrifasciata TaxID=166423 RepID=A0A0M8ZW25_9HYME|nr:hypothetical protein WN51_04229 [Melipona quadrifasciata]